MEPNKDAGRRSSGPRSSCCIGCRRSSGEGLREREREGRRSEEVGSGWEIGNAR